MEFYVALILALSLACVAGVQYFYLMFLEARSRQQQRRIAELERSNAALVEKAHNAHAQLQDALERTGESWPEVIDEDSVLR